MKPKYLIPTLAAGVLVAMTTYPNQADARLFGKKHKVEVTKSDSTNTTKTKEQTDSANFKKDIKDARAYFARIGADLTARFAALGSVCL